MFRLKFFLSLLIVAFSVGSCKFSRQDTGDNATSKKEIITVSIPPQQYLVKQIAGNQFEINIMIPPGANPVTYDPSPGKMKKVANSVAYIKIGHLAFEKNWMNKFASVNPDLKIIDQSKYTNLIKAKKGKKASSRNHGTGVDPHIWTSPEAVKQQIKAIKEGLTELDSSHALVYETNYRNFSIKLDSLNASFKHKLSKMKTRSFMVFHPALSYYARDYNLVQIPIESGGKEPTPSELKNIIDQAKKKRINTIFVQRQFNTDNAKTIAKEVGAKVEVINPLDSNWLNAMNDITTKLVSRDTLSKRDNLND